MKQVVKIILLSLGSAAILLTLIVTLEAKTGLFKEKRKPAVETKLKREHPTFVKTEATSTTTAPDPSRPASTTPKRTAPAPRPAATTTPAKPPVKASISATIASTTPVITTATVSPNLPVHSFAEINTKARAALVNILCTSQSSGSLEPVTGSGVIIDSRGIILTNAHVAQYFLLKDYLVKDFIECVVRTGDLAQPKYKAELLYISPLWIEENYKNITLQDPLGTGEHDFAFLQITGGVNGEVYPSYPALEPETDDDSFVPDQEVLLAGYPAGFLGGISIQRNLYMVSSVVKISRYFTFTENSVDLVSLGGSILAQRGASGGAIVNRDGKLLGIIVTATDAKTTAERDLRAATLSHVDRSLFKQTGMNLDVFFSQDLNLFMKKFESDIFPLLRQKLVSQIETR